LLNESGFACSGKRNIRHFRYGAGNDLIVWAQAKGVNRGPVKGPARGSRNAEAGRHILGSDNTGRFRFAQLVF